MPVPTFNPPLVEQGLRRIRVHPVRRSWLHRSNPPTNQVVGEQYNRLTRVLFMCPYNTSYAEAYQQPFTVRCQVLGLFFVGAVTVWPDITPTVTYDHLGVGLNRYWLKGARAQFGIHVCMARTGQLYVISMFVNGTPQQPGGRGVTVTPVHQLYPCVRRRDDHQCAFGYVARAPHRQVYNHPGYGHTRLGTYQLTVGLSYRSLIDANDMDEPYDVGDRYYVRQQPLDLAHEWGQVFEVTGGLVAARLNELTQTGAGPYFALYVCAGAKLVVHDEYNADINNREHQRNLVQQGGVVIVEGELILRPPNDDRDLRYGLNECGLEGCSLRSAVEATNEAVRNIDCPVLFLGPNESEYGSIAWKLSLQRIHGDNDVREYRPRVCLIDTPDGARFEAIVEWGGQDGGAVELAARHQYERLYESCVQMNNREYMGQQFACPPDRTLMERILTNTHSGADRTVNVDIEEGTGTLFTGNRLDDHQPLPVVYNTHRVLDWMTNADPRNEPPPMAPEFPLLQFQNEAEKVFTPHMKAPIGYGSGDPIGYGYNEVTGRVWPTPYLYQVKDDGQYVQLFEPRGTHTRKLYPYERQPFQTQPKDLCDGHNAYVGIDGWVYKKVDNTELGNCQSVYYSGR